MSVAYPTYFKDLGDGVYFARVPDLNTVTEGYGLADAIKMARDVIGIAMMGYEDSGVEIPKPYSTNPIAEDGEIPSLVDIDYEAYKMKNDTRVVRKNCSIPLYLEREASKRGINFSRVLSDALAQKLGYEPELTNA